MLTRLETSPTRRTQSLLREPLPPPNVEFNVKGKGDSEGVDFRGGGESGQGRSPSEQWQKVARKAHTEKHTQTHDVSGHDCSG